MDELELFSAPEIHKKDIKNIDKTLDTVYELLYNNLEEKIKLYIEKNNIKQYNNNG